MGCRPFVNVNFNVKVNVTQSFVPEIFQFFYSTLLGAQAETANFLGVWMYDTHINACWFQGAPQIWLNTDDDVAIFEDRWRASANLLQFFTEPLAPAQQCSAQQLLIYLALHTSECHTQYSGLISFKYTVQEQAYI